MGAFYRTKVYDAFLPNFIASEIGMIQRTFEVSDSGVAADEYGKKTVKAGTVYPANDATAKGIIFEDVDVTYGSRPASVVIAGRIFENRLHTKPDAAAKTALEKQGIYFDTATEITR